MKLLLDRGANKEATCEVHAPLPPSRTGPVFVCVCAVLVRVCACACTCIVCLLVRVWCAYVRERVLSCARVFTVCLCVCMCERVCVLSCAYAC